MRSTKFAAPPALDERLTLAVPANLKAEVHKVAAARGIGASALARMALAQFLGQAA